jgi:hypothetical protein
MLQALLCRPEPGASMLVKNAKGLSIDKIIVGKNF